MKALIKINYKFIFDRKAKAWIAYNKAYDVSGYGTTKKDALEMFKVSIYHCLELLTIREKRNGKIQ